MDKIILPEHYNYVGVFLTFACNLKCSYCINHYSKTGNIRCKIRDPQFWISNLNRLELKDDLPITLQGGEPACYPGLYELIRGLREDIKIDILTNLTFNLKEFVDKIPFTRLQRKSKYASIRVSYHHETMDLENTINRVLWLQDRGYSVGVWIVDHPRYTSLLHVICELMKRKGIDCRMKEFLGWWEGRLYGTYRYEEALSRESKAVECKPSELLIAPNGCLYKCHAYLYDNISSYGNIEDKDVAIPDAHKTCEHFGMCNPCDIKVKFDRFQIHGHCSVDIRDIT